MKHFFRTHVRSFVVAACVVAIAAVGLTIGLVSSGASRSSATPTTVVPPTTAPPGPTTPAKHKTPRVRGTISAMTPTSWTLTTPKGKTLTVTIGADTKYGSPKAPVAASSFATGQTVVVRGTRSGTTVAATQIVAAPLPHAGSATTPTSAAA